MKPAFNMPRKTRKARMLRTLGVGPQRKLIQAAFYPFGAHVPLYLPSLANASDIEHWATKLKRVRAQRRAVRDVLMLARPNQTPRLPCCILITRIAPRAMDTDNLVNCCKHVRDEIAAWLGCKDGPNDPIVWRYDQQRGEPRTYGVIVRWEEMAVKREEQQP